MNAIVTEYKQSVLGEIPKEWKVVRLGDIFDFKNGLNKEKKYFGKGTPIINYVDVYNKRQINGADLSGRVQVSKSERERFNVLNGDVFFTRTSETIHEIGFTSVVTNVPEGTVFSGFVLRAREKRQTLDELYMKYCFSTYLARKEIIRKSSMTTRALTSGTLLSDVNVIVPPLLEQNKIASILSTWDRAIEIKQEAIIYRKSLLSGLTKSLTKGYKKIEGFQESIWKNTSLDKVFIVRNEKKYASKDLPLYSFTIEDGVTPKSDRYNREFLVKGKKKYKVSKYRDLVFNPANLKYGAIAVNDNKEDVLISPIYETLVIKDTNKYDIDFFNYLLTHSEMIGFYKSKVEGTLIERSAVKVDAFLLFQFDVPSIEEQRKISKILKTIDKSINLMQKEVELLKLQKQGLMQQLLTGKIRVQS